LKDIRISTFFRTFEGEQEMSTALQSATRRVLVGVGFLFSFLLMGQPALAQIAGSKHDLTANTNTYYQTSTAEICVFCHTPHGASNAAPLWNRGAPATASFTVYSSATLDGTLATGGVTGSISGACLSCHDGATALDLLINAPGSGGYNPGGLAAGYAWSVAGNTLTGAGITNIGGDLSNDHPISIPYCGGITATNTCTDGDFKTAAVNRHIVGGATTTGATALVQSAGATDQYWIDTSVGTGSVRDKTDVLLYVRAFGANNQPSVECASCHEPHNGGASGTPFLRIANAASALCTTCHNK